MVDGNGETAAFERDRRPRASSLTFRKGLSVSRRPRPQVAPPSSDVVTSSELPAWPPSRIVEWSSQSRSRSSAKTTGLPTALTKRPDSREADSRVTIVRGADQAAPSPGARDASSIVTSGAHSAVPEYQTEARRPSESSQSEATWHILPRDSSFRNSSA